MTEVYSTQDLIAILTAERQACMQGQRLNLTVQVSGNPVIDRFLRSEGLQKFKAYQDFKATIHRYQQEHQVSGLVWRQVMVKGKTLRFPVVDENLIALPSDVDLLKAYQEDVLGFWYRVTTEMDLYLKATRLGYLRVSQAEVEAIAARTEWATIWTCENSTFLEVALQLAWGKPEEASYQWGLPASGSESIHAVNPGSRPIG